jgi:uncharacterized protein (TIGR02996 family)
MLPAFLQDIKEHPEDDTPRLVLADWLEEHGGPTEAARARLIRAQCALARLDEDDPARAPLQEQVRQLIDAHGQQWLGPLVARVLEATWHRGLCRIELGADNFLDREPGAAPFWADLAQTDAYAWLDGLSLSNLRHGDLARLLALERLSTLTSLRLVACGLGPKGAERLADCPHLAGLHELDLGDNQIGPAGAADLARSRHLTGVRALNLWANDLGVAGVETLVGLGMLRRLRRLSLAYNALGAEGMEVLAPHVGHLEKLEVWSNDIGPRGVEALLASPLLDHARELDLPWNDLRDDGCAVLASSPRMAGVRKLWLFCNQIEDAGAAALAASPHLAGLEVLDLDANHIGDEGALALARSDHLQHVRLLSVAKNTIAPAAACRLKERFGQRVHLEDG